MTWETLLAPWIPMLTMLAGAIGAGLAASALLTWLRTTLPIPEGGPANQMETIVLSLLHAPRFARFLILGLTLAIGAAANVLLGLITGVDPNIGIGALLAFVSSQIVHAVRELSPWLPLPPDPEPDGTAPMSLNAIDHAYIDQIAAQVAARLPLPAPPEPRDPA